MKNFDLTKDKITSFAAGVMHIKDTKEEVSFQQGHMTLTLKLTAQVDPAVVRKQLAARQVEEKIRANTNTFETNIELLREALEKNERK